MSRQAMERSCNGTSSLMNMGFGDNSSGLCPTLNMMMMPLVTSNHHHHPINPNLNSNPNPSPNPDEDTNSLYYLMPSCTNNNNNNNNNNHDLNSNRSGMLQNNHNTNSTGLGYFMEINHNNNNNNNNNNDGSSSSFSSSFKAKIRAHPHYHRLLAAYVNCQKIGAPPEVVTRLEEAVAMAAGDSAAGTTGSLGEDPALDQFMEAYCEMLIKYEQELSKPFNEAMLFLHRIECQFKSLALSSPDFACDEARNGSPEHVDGHNNTIDPQAEDQELKHQLLRKYSGYLGSLKQEFTKKRKKGKLPKEARQQLLEWWSRHYKWPYPSESQKLALAEATGLDPKQINNWFINQRKRHWKPSEDMQFVIVDPSHPHYYMDHNVLGNPFPMDLSHTMF